MKKTLIILFLAVTLIASTSAQTALKNGGMENWRTAKLAFNPLTPLDLPSGGWGSFDSFFNTVNFIATFNTTVVKQITKNTTDKYAGSSSVEVTTKEYGGLGVMPGYLSNCNIAGDANFNISFTGGQTIAARPKFVSAYLKYKPASSFDTANFYAEVINTTTGVDSVIGDGFVNISSLSNFTKLNLNLDYYESKLPANILRVYFSSSMGDDTVVAHSLNSVLLVDDVSYTTASSEVYALMSDFTVNCFPNPATNEIQIIAATKQVLKAELLSIDGKLLRTENFCENVRINVADFSAGSYLYQIRNAENVILKNGNFSVIR